MTVLKELAGSFGGLPIKKKIGKGTDMDWRMALYSRDRLMKYIQMLQEEENSSNLKFNHTLT